MANFQRGDLVLVSFPLKTADAFAPAAALILLDWPLLPNRTNYLLCLVDRRVSLEPFQVPLAPSDVNGVMSDTMYILPTYMVTAPEYRISKYLGTVAQSKFNQVLDMLFGALDDADDSEAADEDLEL